MLKTDETKTILKEWNQFLLKESNFARVKKMIDTLERSKSKIIIKASGDLVTIFYGQHINDTYSESQYLHGKINCRSSIEMFGTEANPPHGVRQGIGKGEKNSTWYVTLTRKTTKGMGPLLYEVLIEYISRFKNCALKPDSYAITDQARDVWEKFDARSDIISIPLDIDKETVNDYRKYGVNIEQLTPDNIKDDTQQNSAIHDKSEEFWQHSSLSKAYRKDNTALIDELERRNLYIARFYHT